MQTLCRSQFQHAAEQCRGGCSANAVGLGDAGLRPRMQTAVVQRKGCMQCNCSIQAQGCKSECRLQDWKANICSGWRAQCCHGLTKSYLIYNILYITKSKTTETILQTWKSDVYIWGVALKPPKEWRQWTVWIGAASWHLDLQCWQFFLMRFCHFTS